VIDILDRLDLDGDAILLRVSPGSPADMPPSYPSDFPSPPLATTSRVAVIGVTSRAAANPSEQASISDSFAQRASGEAFVLDAKRPQSPSKAERASSRNLTSLRSERSRSIHEDLTANPAHNVLPSAGQAQHPRTRKGGCEISGDDWRARPRAEEMRLVDCLADIPAFKSLSTLTLAPGTTTSHPSLSGGHRPTTNLHIAPPAAAFTAAPASLIRSKQPGQPADPAGITGGID
jgi:hypothetical protein